MAESVVLIHVDGIRLEVAKATQIVVEATYVY